MNLDYLEILWSDVRDFVEINKKAFPPLILANLSKQIKSIIEKKSISTPDDVDNINTFSNLIMEDQIYII